MVGQFGRQLEARARQGSCFSSGQQRGRSGVGMGGGEGKSLQTTALHWHGHTPIRPHCTSHIAPNPCPSLGDFCLETRCSSLIINCQSSAVLARVKKSSCCTLETAEIFQDSHTQAGDNETVSAGSGSSNHRSSGATAPSTGRG